MSGSSFAAVRTPLTWYSNGGNKYYGTITSEVVTVCYSLRPYASETVISRSNV